ncbi:ATPase family AAA domain-containing protein 5-like [Hyla sarda]|uniref:ATPase family AAA domain-containing protein 5-like n=1 Tax=Hyla sarda TaxID=327740 RepID=UPI0024C2F22A|nr:ATPase family AAA domain-containing protein 5-like [Hyla sarda]
MRAKGLGHSGHKEVKKGNKGGVITIDDSSEVSENSQDDGQFKARREFLMSGLPDSLRRQIAKTSAIMEAYSVSGSSFHTVLHVQQRDGCTMWSLVMPRCPMLTDLSPLCDHVPDITDLALSVGDFTHVTPGSAVQPFPAAVPKRPVFSDSIRDFLLEEIRWQNPQFPVRRFFKQFLKKQSDNISLLDASMSETQQTEKRLEAAADISSVQETGSGAKRKRKDSPHTKTKRRKPADEEPHCDSAPNPQLSRSSRRKSSTPAEPDMVLIEEEEGPKAPAEEAAIEDVLWTEKYQPHNSSELIGNSAAIRRLHSWLREWKIRAEKEEKRMLKAGKDKDDSWSVGDFHDSEDSDEEDSLCNTLLISGPPGVGKTAAVYACAQELGFKVFEVNASCQRSGRQILAQLKEATQSHQVDQQGVNAYKPCFFSSTRSPRKLLNSPKKVVSSPRKPPMSPRGPGLKRGLAPKSLVNFFKAAPKQKPGVKGTAEPVRAQQSGSDIKINDGKPSRSLSSISDGSEESHRKTATSLILFEEVDIIFEDDTGFLSAVKTFMSTTKRPVILTTSDPTFRMTFDGTFEEISFRSPSVVNVCSFLQVLCLAENLRMDRTDLMTFLTMNGCDIRRSLLHLQFWARSGGGGSLEKPLPPPDKRKMEASDGVFRRDPEMRSAEVPGCSVGCAENLMGVNSILAPNYCLISFVRDKILEAVEWERILRLLSEFHCRNISFTSSNLELLLPLPVHILEPVVQQVPAPAPEDDDSFEEDANVKPSAAMRRRRKLVLLNDSDLFESDSNSVDEVVGAGAKDPEEERPGDVGVVRRVLSSTERQASLLVYQCLDSMTEYADHMSFLDCATCDPSDPAYTHRPSWTESRLKNGLCDGLRTRGQDWWGAQNCGDIRGLIEALSFHKCSSTLSTALSSLELCKLSGKDPTEELTLRVTAAREQVNFGEPAATTDLAESRRSVVRDVMSHRAFVGLGNRDANVTEYLPALRTICHLEKEKEEGKTKRRFLHYLEGIHLELGRVTLGRLAADFP